MNNSRHFRKKSFMVDDILSNGGNEQQQVKPLEDTDDADSSEVRKLRTTFSSEQIFHLEMRFEKQKYLSARERLELSKKLKLSDNQIKTWYQNRRMKLKRQVKQGIERYHQKLYIQSLNSCFPEEICNKDNYFCHPHNGPQHHFQHPHQQQINEPTYPEYLPELFQQNALHSFHEYCHTCFCQRTM